MERRGRCYGPCPLAMMVAGRETGHEPINNLKTGSRSTSATVVTTKTYHAWWISISSKFIKSEPCVEAPKPTDKKKWCPIKHNQVWKLFQSFVEILKINNVFHFLTNTFWETKKVSKKVALIPDVFSRILLPSHGHVLTNIQAVAKVSPRQAFWRKAWRVKPKHSIRRDLPIHYCLILSIFISSSSTNPQFPPSHQ